MAAYLDLLRANVAPVGYAIVLVLLFLLTLVLVRLLILELRSGDVPRIESHWGGFGGGLGGWQISRSLVYLVAALGFAMLSVTALGYAARDLRPATAAGPSNTQTPPDSEKPSEKPADKPADKPAGSQAPSSSSNPPTKPS